MTIIIRIRKSTIYFYFSLISSGSVNYVNDKLL